jgi:medium-chain acyl-[acyl-carrier-protein] hydrolase
MPPPVDPWIPFRKPRPGAKIRLFCFPYAGGGASVFRGWQEELPATIEVCAVQLPGREGRLREKPVPDLTALVSMIAGGLAPHLDMPFAFFGYSMGSWIGFELCRELRRHGGPAPRRLVVAACPAPHIPDDDATHHLPDEELIERLRDLGGMSPEVLAHRELMDMILPVFRADAAVTETHRHVEEPPLDVPIHAMGGLSDEKAGRADMEAWQRHTTGAFALQMFPGGHFFLQTARATLIEAIGKALG